jgi:hypothetical protein
MLWTGVVPSGMGQESPFIVYEFDEAELLMEAIDPDAKTATTASTTIKKVRPNTHVRSQALRLIPKVNVAS